MKSDVENFEEGPLARAIENQTAKLPSDIFLWAALASIDRDFSCASNTGAKKERTVCGSMGADLPIVRDIQQAGKAVGLGSPGESGFVLSSSKEA